MTPAEGRLEASSPDEVALVEGVQKFGAEILRRNDKAITVKSI